MSNQRRFRSIGLLCAVTVAISLAGCGGGAASDPPNSGGTGGTKEKNLERASAADLVAFYQEKLRLRAVRNAASGSITALPQPIFSPPAAGDVANAVSATNNQEAGVDEEDLIKTDGNLIYTLEQAVVSSTSAVLKPVLSAYQRNADNTVTRTTVQGLGVSQAALGMHFSLAGQRVVVLARENLAEPAIGVPALITSPGAATPFYTYYKPRLALQFHAANTTLASQARWDIDGTLIASRLIGSTLYVALNYTPNLAVDRLAPNATSAEREAAISALTVNDLLPKIAIGDQVSPLLGEQDCYVQKKNASTDLGLTVLLAINLESTALTRTARCFAGGSEAVYMTPANLYLATTRYEYQNQNGIDFFPVDINTDVHKFALAGSDFNYKGSGSVVGHLGWSSALKSYRLSEDQADLRVLTFTGQSTGWLGNPIFAVADNTPKPAASPATLTVLREGKDADGAASLQVIATLPNSNRPAAIGKEGEQVYAVRFFGSKAYVVTFRRTDPLYVLDLSNPNDPKVAGALEVPGFSDYLLPVSDSLLLGVGKDAPQGRVGGVKVALYDVSNPASPTELAQKVYGNQGSYSGIDVGSHGLNYLQRGNVLRLTLPMALNAADPNAGRSSLSKGLYRFEVNAGAKTLVEKPTLGLVQFDQTNPASYINYSLEGDRAIQINDSVYYLQASGLKAFAW
jgi:hypothetical protein